MTVVGLDHVQLAAPAGCEDEARRFFGGVLGLSEVQKPAGLRARGGVWFAVGGQQLHIGVADPFHPAAKAHPAFVVSPGPRELDDLARRLSEAGAPVTWDDAVPSTRRFFSSDPWGNRIELLAGVGGASQAFGGGGEVARRARAAPLSGRRSP